MSSKNWAPVRFDTILVRYIFKDDVVWWRALLEELSYTGTGDDVLASGVLLFDAMQEYDKESVPVDFLGDNMLR